MHYHFLSLDEFAHIRDEGGLLESAKVHGNWYGTPLDQVRGILAAGRDAILTIDPQGARSVRDRVHDALLIFVMPPSIEDLDARLAEPRVGGSPTRWPCGGGTPRSRWRRAATTTT